VGLVEGSELGRSVGLGVGNELGWAVGEAVGDVGITVGWVVGKWVGSRVGNEVGGADGSEDGCGDSCAAEGNGVGMVAGEPDCPKKRGKKSHETKTIIGNRNMAVIGNIRAQVRQNWLTTK